MPKESKLDSLKTYTPSERVLRMYEYFVLNASPTHAVSMPEILAYLNSMDIFITNKMVYMDIEKLNSVMDVGIEWSAKKKGYILRKPKFEPYELELMVDSIQSSKFITQSEAQKICKKISSLTDRYTAALLNRQSYVVNRSKSKNDKVVKQLEKLYFCINENYQVSFQYAHYTPSKEKKYSKDGSRHIVSPFAVLWNDGNCYLYAYNKEKADFRHYRVDRMENIKTSLLPRDGVEEFKKINLRDYQSKVFNMYGGKEEGVWLLCANYPMADVIIDRFGKDVTLIPVDKTHFKVWVKVEISRQFYAWLCSFGKSIKVLSPQRVVDEMRDYVKTISEMYKEDGEK